jgi:hypothetical protein
MVLLTMSHFHYLFQVFLKILFVFFDVFASSFYVEDQVVVNGFEVKPFEFIALFEEEASLCVPLILICSYFDGFFNLSLIKCNACHSFILDIHSQR